MNPVSAMSWEIDLENLKDCENPEEYYEEYRVDVDDDELERILECADGRIEVHDDIVTRYMPECGGKSNAPSVLIGMASVLQKSLQSYYWYSWCAICWSKNSCGS